MHWYCSVLVITHDGKKDSEVVAGTVVYVSVAGWLRSSQFLSSSTHQQLFVFTCTWTLLTPSFFVSVPAPVHASPGVKLYVLDWLVVVVLVMIRQTTWGVPVGGGNSL